MTRLPRISGEQVIKILERMGFEQSRQKGSHITLKKTTPEGVVGCVVPLHKEVAVGTLRSVLRQAHLSPDEFMSNM